MPEPELRVYVRHMRQVNFCMKGTRAWFEARGWSWSAFVAEGRPAQDFIDTGDPLALRTVEAARKEAADGR